MIDWSSVALGAFSGIAAVFGVTAIAIYPLVRRSYLLWGVARAIFFTVMVFALFPLEMADGTPERDDMMILAEAALALGAGATGPFLADYIEPKIRIGRARYLLFAMLPLGAFAAIGSWIGHYAGIFNRLHDLALLVCTVLLAAGLYQAIKAGSRAARFQIFGWGPLIGIGLVAFSYELILARDLPYWPYILLAGLALDFVVTATGIVDGFVVVQHERDRALANIEAAQLMTVTDSLTNIANRRGLEQHFSDPVRRRPTGLALVDCDHFKRINDQFGHDVGDKVLCAVARGLEGDHVFAARLGGEEFVLLLYSKNWQEAAENARRRITQAVRDTVPELPYPITASAGLAALEANDSLGSVMKRADRALYAAKEAGRNRSLSLTEFRPTGSLKLA